MLSTILNCFLNVVDAIFGFFDDIMTELGMMQFLVITLLLVLFVGHVVIARVPDMHNKGGSSDRVKRKKSEERSA